MIAAVLLGIAGLSALVLTSSGQPRPIDIPQLNTDLLINGVSNLRVGSMSADGTETTLIMEYTYNGNNGPTALLVPVIDSRNQNGISGWFGAEQVAVPRGRGPVSFKVKFFNDEPGVPPTVTTDRIQIWILNQSGTVRIGGSTELKTIKWGREGITPTTTTSSAHVDRPGRDVAQLAAEAEARAREEARRAAEAEEQARHEAEARETARRKADAEARAAAEAREAAKLEALKQAEEKKRLEAKAAAEAKERAEAQRRAEAEAKRLQEEQRKAEERARAEAQQRERERLQAEARKREEERKVAEAEAARLAEEKRKAEEKSASELREREQARQEAEELARRQEEERRTAEAKAREEETARVEAQRRADAEARNRAEAEAKAAEVARLKAEEEAIERAALSTAPPPATSLRSKVTNVEVVNRSLDRSQMTIGVEFDLRDRFPAPPFMGIEVQHSANPGINRHFVSEPKEIGRQKFLLLNVRYQPQGSPAPGTMLSDRLNVYLTDVSQAMRTLLHPATMLLVWRAPNQEANATEVPAVEAAKPVELGDFRQRSPQSGYARVNYQIPDGEARLRVRLKNSSMPGSDGWFIAEPVSVKGTGLELISVSLSNHDKVPSGTITVDTIEVELVNSEGAVIGRDEKATQINWSKDG